MKVSDYLSSEELVALTQRSDARAWWAFAMNLGLIAAAFGMAIAWPNPLTIVLAVLILAGRQLGLGIRQQVVRFRREAHHEAGAPRMVRERGQDVRVGHQAQLRRGRALALLDLAVAGLGHAPVRHRRGADRRSRADPPPVRADRSSLIRVSGRCTAPAISATTSQTASGVATSGVGIRSRSSAKAPLSRSTGAPLMPVPPTSIPSAIVLLPICSRASFKPAVREG